MKLPQFIMNFMPRRTPVETGYSNKFAFESASSLRPDQSNVSSVETYYQIYKNEAPVRGAINVITNAVTSTGYDVVTVKEGDVDKSDPRVAEISQWLGSPVNEFYNVLRDITLLILVHDNAFIEITPHDFTKNTYGWMYPLDTRAVEPKYSPDGKKIIALVHTSTRATVSVTLKEDEFIHSAMNKMGALVGLSPLESLVGNVNLYHAAKDYNQSLFDSNGQPNTAYVLEEGSTEDFKIMVQKVRETKKGEDICIKGKVKVTPLGGQASETSYDKLVEGVYQDIMTVYSVPPVMMSKPGASTLESSREEMSAFAMNVQAIQEIINSTVNRCILRIWGDGYADIRFVLKPWVNDKVQAVIDAERMKIGATMPNEIRTRDGLPPVEWGDVPYNPNAPLGKGMGEIPDDMMELQQQQMAAQQSKPQGPADGAPGRPGEIERPGNVKGLDAGKLDLESKVLELAHRALAVDAFWQEYYSPKQAGNHG